MANTKTAERQKTRAQEPEAKEEKEQGTQVATTGRAPTPAALLKRMQDDAGKGASQAAKDNIVPMVYVLQGLSPQVNPKKDQYIEGAAPGSFWLRNSPMGVVDGDLGFAFQQVGFESVVVEWVPRDDGGGFVARHEYEGPEQTIEQFAKRNGAHGVEKENSRALRWVTERGTEFVDTKYHYGIIWGGLFGLAAWPGFSMPFVLPCSSTQIRGSRELNFMINQQHIRDENDNFVINQKTGEPYIMPAWSRLYRIRTRGASNKAGEWSVITPDDPWGAMLGQAREGSDLSELVQGGIAKSVLQNEGAVTEQMYERGARLNQAVAAKEVRAEDEVNAGQQQGAGSGGAGLEEQAREAGI